MCQSDSQGVGGVGRGSFGKSEESPNHEGDLGFVGGSFSDDGFLYFFGRIFVNREPMAGGSDEWGGPGSRLTNILPKK